ncbi:hypothetical protein L9F63_010550 [Diploptera punctata]|uniref:Uncharacterized protein n=1 Tax=Diploptera punctata TaxID=6984 RepID=A0AAD8AH35_DIPPU|nr:hypothetical protein L9F63_010550 [Diploptera punctata]
MPLDFDEKILRDLFLYFGNPLEIYKSDGWAFVSYGTRREAEFAIHELNNMPPYFLKVQFAFIPKEKERIHDEMSQNYILNAILDSEPRHYTRLSYNCVRNVGIGRGHGFDLPFPITPRHRPGEFEEMVFSDHDDKEGGNMHHYLHPQSTGFLLPPVSGIKIREYTEQQHKKIKQNLEILCAKVTGDFLQSTENSIKPCLAGNCLHCNKLTMQFCQRCRGSYCSRECQVDDWSNHKSKCVPIVMPTVTSASDVNSDKSVSFDHGYKFSKCFVQEPKYEARDKRQFGSKSSFNGRNSYNVDKSNSTSYRQKHNSEDIEKTKSGFGTNKNYSTYGSFKYSGNKSSINERLKIRMSTSSEDSTVDRSKNVSELKGSLPLYDLPSKEVINSDILTSSGDSITKSCNLEETDVLEIGKLTNDVFKKAKVVVVIGQFQCWVQLEDSITKLQEVMYALNNGSLGSVMTSVKEGIICAALYEGLWYRGKVTSVEPKLKVLYIDFGNEECCTLDQLRSVPDAVKNISVGCEDTIS